MSSLIKRKSSMVLPELHEYQCSGCSHKLETTRETIEFCWHCGVKFEPTPPVPTEGEWSYDSGTGRLYATRRGQEITVCYAGGQETYEERMANGYLMAASKKLLAIAKRIPATGEAARILNIYNPRLIIDAQEAITEAEKGKQ